MPSPQEIFNNLPSDRLHHNHSSDSTKPTKGIVAVDDGNGGQEIFARNAAEINKNYDSELPRRKIIHQQQHFDISNNGIIMNRNKMNFSNEQETLNGSYQAVPAPVRMTMHGGRDISSLAPSSSIRSQEAQFMVNPTSINANENTINKQSNFGVGQKGMKDLVASARKFPMKLMIVLSIEEFEPIISWDAHGVSFTIHDADRLSKEVLPKFFKGTKYSSFLRKLYRWGFAKRREMSGKKVRALSYSNPRFRRGNIDLCKTILCECDESDRTDFAGKLLNQNGVATQNSPNAQEKAASLATGMIGDGLNGEQAMMMQSNMASHPSTIHPNNNNMNMMIRNRDGLTGQEEVYYMIPVSSLSTAMSPNNSNNTNMNMMIMSRDGLNGEQAMMMQSNIASNSSAMLANNNNMNMMIMNRDGLNGEQAMMMQSNPASNSSTMLPSSSNNNTNMMIMNRDGLNGEEVYYMMQSNPASNSSAMLPSNNNNMMIMNRDGLNGDQVFYATPSNSSAMPYNNNMTMARRVMPRNLIQRQPMPTFNGQSFTVGQNTRLAHSMPALPVQVHQPCLEQPIRSMQTLQNTTVPHFERRIPEMGNGQRMDMQLKMQRQENTDTNFE